MGLHEQGVGAVPFAGSPFGRVLGSWATRTSKQRGFREMAMKRERFECAAHYLMRYPYGRFMIANQYG
jgi:hypothetical protein